MFFLFKTVLFVGTVDERKLPNQVSVSCRGGLTVGLGLLSGAGAK